MSNLDGRVCCILWKHQCDVWVWESCLSTLILSMIDDRCGWWITNWSGCIMLCKGWSWGEAIIMYVSVWKCPFSNCLYVRLKGMWLTRRQHCKWVQTESGIWDRSASKLVSQVILFSDPRLQSDFCTNILKTITNNVKHGAPEEKQNSPTDPAVWWQYKKSQSPIFFSLFLSLCVSLQHIKTCLNYYFAKLLYLKQAQVAWSIL